MATKRTNRPHVQLDMGDLFADEAALENQVTSILKLAPSSPICVAQNMKDAVTDLDVRFMAYKASADTIAFLRAQLVLEITNHEAARQSLGNGILLVKTLTETTATSEADILSMAFHARTGRPGPPPLLPPESIDVLYGRKGYGKLKVSAHELGKTPYHYACDYSPDPVTDTSWKTATGNGKSRWFTGTPGTSIWVRFAMVRGQSQSEWSTPIRVTFP